MGVVFQWKMREKGKGVGRVGGGLGTGKGSGKSMCKRLSKLPFIRSRFLGRGCDEALFSLKKRGFQ